MNVGVSYRAVHDDMPQSDEDNHRMVFHAIGETATDDTSCADSESKLERAEERLRNGRRYHMGGCERHIIEPYTITVTINFIYMPMVLYGRES